MDMKLELDEVEISIAIQQYLKRLGYSIRSSIHNTGIRFSTAGALRAEVSVQPLPPVKEAP